jgi:hypothetical protein
MNFKKSYFIAISVFFAILLSFLFYAAHFEKPMFTHFDGIPLFGLWQFNLPVVDEHGNYLYTDGDLNMAILIHADMSENERHEIIRNYLPMWIAQRKSVIFKETKNELVVNAMENSLIVVNNSSGTKAIIPLNFNLHKEHHLKLYRQYHNSKVDTSIYNLFQDIIKILPDHDAKINEVYFSAKGGQPESR